MIINDTNLLLFYIIVLLVGIFAFLLALPALIAKRRSK
jgi:hypothetical protein